MESQGNGAVGRGVPAAAAGTALSAVPILAAPAGSTKSFKVALIGCGGRGNGALEDHMNAVKCLNDKHGLGLAAQVVAAADWFKQAAETTGKKYAVPADKCFGGADGYKKAIEAGPDIVLMATPPVFRPVHFEAAVKAGKHVFFEKPVAVDPPGVRRVLATGDEAKKKNLVVVAGTQRRHDAEYNQKALAAKERLRGRIFGGRVSWCMGKFFGESAINPKGADDLVGPGKWWCWSMISGDHVVEQHVHNIDVANWFLGGPPVSAGGFGYRARRVGGNMYDFFSVDFEYPNKVHIHSMCRQINGCWNFTGEEFTYEKPEGGKPSGPDPYADVGYHSNPYVSEHAHLLWAIAKGKELNETQAVAQATGAAILSRESAYNGNRIAWDEMFGAAERQSAPADMPGKKSAPADPKRKPAAAGAFADLQRKPTAEDFESGQVEMPKDGDIPVPGK
jgi:myo-inositol 2-dehydrogenase/D-chiro-inositol 1-dehydrogenase